MSRFGYACLAPGVEGTRMQSCTMRTASPERLRSIIAHNLTALRQLVAYNAENAIRLFRISSDLIPFGSSPVNTLPWQREFAGTFAEIGDDIAAAGIRVSMHPGQYTVLSSPDGDVVGRAAADLDYHEQVLRLLKTDTAGKLILHVGGVYGDKPAALERFCRSWGRLSDTVRSRLVLENDERFYHIADVLQLAGRLGVPAVFDCLHHAIHPPQRNLTPAEWITECAETWKASDGRQKIHYSQQNRAGKPGAHSQTIRAGEFLRFYETIRGMDLDVMLEVKDKNRSAVKCGLLASGSGSVAVLEREWARYKYRVLEHSPQAYLAIRERLKEKNRFSAAEFYEIVEKALEEPVGTENAVNAMLHVWGYFKDRAQPGEKKRFFSALERYRSGGAKAETVKNQLLRLAQTYGERYLLDSYYFL